MILTNKFNKQGYSGFSGMGESGYSGYSGYAGRQITKGYYIAEATSENLVATFNFLLGSLISANIIFPPPP